MGPSKLDLRAVKSGWFSFTIENLRESQSSLTHLYLGFILNTVLGKFSFSMDNKERNYNIVIFYYCTQHVCIFQLKAKPKHSLSISTVLHCMTKL